MNDRDGRKLANRRSRRSVLAAGAGLAGLVGTAGCLGDTERVRVLSAGSLAVVLEERIGPAFEAETSFAYQGEYHGTNAVMRLVESGTKRPDVIVSADAGLLRDRLYPDHADWDVEFAANEVGIAYDPGTELGARLEAGDPWYAVFDDAGPDEIAISDPDLDPLGYRAVLLFELAEREHDLEGFRDAMLERASREPDEPQLLAGVESGNRACAVAYRNMAVDRDLPFLELSDAYNFGNPEYAPQYAEVSYTTDEGDTVVGSPTVYNATVRPDADAAAGGREFVSFLLEQVPAFEAHGLRVDDSLPRVHGDAPKVVAP
ncbi:extracellular solute-binding protein [Halopiger djelfimassiliensis]|uniref:extracellular solute-binding protein n=1 Tax=Halopiger djelfimassiliensis TaxID=1293047 RepID=UPI0006782756|nr:extracellular solute-binding protein [Halopiger djelfimassiliensis]